MRVGDGTVAPGSRARGADGLIATERDFVNEFMIDKRQAEALRRCRPGLKPDSYATSAQRIMSRPQVKAEIARRTTAAVAKSTMTLDDVIRELTILATSNTDDYVTIAEDGTPRVDFKKIAALPEAERRQKMGSISSLETEAVSDLVLKTKYKLYDKQSALVQLGRHLGLRDGQVPVAPPAPVNVSVIVTNDPAEAARAYQRMIEGKG